MLVGLTAFSSKGHHLVHEIFFVLFVGSTYLYMWLSTYLFRQIHNYANFCKFALQLHCQLCNFPDDIKIKSYQARIRTLKRSTFTILSLILLYWYHNASCHKYVYSLFSVAQYIFVSLVIHFHWCAYYDFEGLSVKVILEKVDGNSGEKFTAINMHENRS